MEMNYFKKTGKMMVAFHCDILKGSYYLVPTVRFDTSITNTFVFIISWIISYYKSTS